MPTSPEISQDIRRPEMSPREPYFFLKPDTLLSSETRERFSKLTVVHVAPPWLPIPGELRDYGGVENVIEDLIGGLAQLGVKEQRLYGHKKNAHMKQSHPVTTFAPRVVNTDADLFYIFDEDPVEAGEIERDYLSQVYSHIEETLQEGTIVHDHTTIGRFQADRFPNVPVLVTEHERVGGIKVSLERKAYLIHQRGYPNVFSIAATTQQRLTNPLINWLGVIHHGIDVRKFDFRDKQANPLQEDYGLYLGLVCYEKGLLHAINVAEEAGSPLKIAGPIEQNSTGRLFFDKLVTPRLSDKIQYVGPANRAERRKLLRDASWVAMLSDVEEPFGLVMAEALMSGTPVLGTDVGQIPEIITDGVTGHIVNKSSRFFDQASAAVNSIRRGNISSLACRRDAEMRFSAPVMAARYAEAYLEASDRIQRRILRPTGT